MRVTIRTAEEKDFLDVYNFVSDCKPLEKYAEHFYKIMLRYFGDTCFIAEHDNNIAGFIMGFISQRHDNTYFLWQIGVGSSFQGKGIGEMLLKEVEKEVRKLGCNRIELTIDPENHSSQKLFEKMGYKNTSLKEGKTVKVGKNIAVKDYYKPGRHFILYEKRIPSC